MITTVKLALPHESRTRCVYFSSSAILLLLRSGKVELWKLRRLANQEMHIIYTRGWEKSRKERKGVLLAKRMIEEEEEI